MFHTAHYNIVIHLQFQLDFEVKKNIKYNFFHFIQLFHFI